MSWRRQSPVPPNLDSESVNGYVRYVCEACAYADDARPFAANPSIAAPRRSQRSKDHELVGETISIQWVFDDDGELEPATALNAERYGDDDVVWYDAVVQKVTPKLVEVFYPDDNETKRHNLLVSGITKKRPKPLRDYMAKGVRWKIKK